MSRLDHLICEVPDIDEAVDVFLGLGFPLAWPIGRFWPDGYTAGVALGGINLEFVQPDEDAPGIAQIRTLAFEPVDLQIAADKLISLGCEVQIAEKWEDNPELLRLRGFSEEESKVPQLICTNAIPFGESPFDFFLCEYSPGLHARLSQHAFPPMLVVDRIILGSPTPWEDWRPTGAYFGLPMRKRGVEIGIREEPNPFREVVEIVSDRGPLDLGDWQARFRFT